MTYAEEETVQVGKYVTPSTDAPTMILSLLLVLLVVIASAFVLKKFQVTTQGTSALKVVTSVHLGTKEKLVVVQVGEKQLLLGVTPTQISLLDTLEQPIDTGKNVTELFDNSVVNMLKKSMNKNG
jgi:flagellar protein FliO/FliZ